ncbi:MAG TPA: hemerythrin domain-containing protein [Arenibaculum sp.]|nr:hemerythrin domain-containing protein [Arenibaculum sp.]
MTIIQLIQSSSAKASDLLTKLADTSDGAVKTREKLLSEFKDEFELFARSEEQHLYPVLRKHKETKDLVSGAIDDNKQVRKLLAELEQMPKNDEGFAGKVAELKKIFQQHVRDEKKELLPAVRKALSDEEAQGIVEKIEAEKTETEDAKRQEAEQRRAEARQEREETERREAEAAETKRREAEQRRAEARREREKTERREAEAAESERQVHQTTATVTRLAESMAQSPLRTAEAGINAAAEATRQSAGLAARAVERTTASAGTTARALQEMAQPAGLRTETFANLPGVVANVASDANRAWVEWVNSTAETGLRASQGLMGLRSPQQIVEVQGRFIQETLQAWLDVNRKMMRISAHASEEMLQSVKRPGGRERKDRQGRR